MPSSEAFRPRPALSRRFFSTDGTLNGPWMHIEAELLLDQSRQFACSDWLARNEPRSKKRQDLALDLVGATRTALLGYQPGDAGLLEIRLGLVVSWPRNAILVGGIGHRHFLDGDAAQHLVFDLHSIARIEKVAVLKLGITNLLGGRVQRALFAESGDLRALAIVPRAHGLRLASPRHQLLYMCGKIIITSRRCLARSLLAKTRYQIGEFEQVRDPKEGTPLPYNDLGIRGGRVRPLRRNRANDGVVDPQQQPLSRAVIPLTDAKELPAAERVERMRYPHKLG
jgi:hypothetical protein